MSSLYGEIDMIIPIQLNIKNLEKRIQSKYFIAYGISGILDIPFSEIDLIRSTSTARLKANIIDTRT
ncbi:MAG: hypothetical protein EOO86_12220 [Pedobacter sp.]|nr:MAG: hypothetical protein EOO86_12220 [Pedobacter sp.]